jgi:hypothetical protein
MSLKVDTFFTRFPVLSTQRLRLRQLLPADAADLFVIKSDLEVTKHYGPTESAKTSRGV